MLDSGLRARHAAGSTVGGDGRQGSDDMAEMKDRSVSIGSVFSRAFGVMGNNPLVVFGVALVLGAGPQLLYSILIGTNLATAAAEGGDPIRTAVIGGLAVFLVSMISRSLVSGCITRATVAYSQGHRAGLGECLGVALRRAVPVIVVSILFGIMVLLGLILLVVPGIILAVMWSVVVPITVEERTGILGAFNRSQELTRGARWTIFGLFLLIFLIGLGIGLVGILVSTVILGLSYENPAISASAPALVMNALVLTLASAFSSALITSLFVELREWKDGPEDSKLSDIFA